MSWLLLAGLVGCARDKGIADDGGCADSSQCQVGEGCVDGACVVAECFTSADCSLGTICYPDIYTCVDGCETDVDCFAGQSCEDGRCQDDLATCSSTFIDCGIGEICDAGECAVPAEPFCEQCYDNPSLCEDQGGSPDYACYTLPEFEPGEARCGLPCAVDEECPQGFYCGTIGYSDGSTVTNCMGPCSLLD